MIKLFLFFLLPFSLYASKILSYNIYDRTDRVDVMITFDIPYEGVIKKSRSSSRIVLKLQDASIESSKLKQISSDFLQTLAITPLADHVQLIASISEDVILKVSKTSDSYGLRLRFQKEALSKNTPNDSLFQKTSSTARTQDLSGLPTKKSDNMGQSYYIVVAILIIGIIILFIVNKKIASKNTNASKDVQSNAKTQKEIINRVPDASSSEVSIRFQKNIDEQNSVVMLDFMDQSYLVMMGANNVLLDRFSDDKPTSSEEFNVILQEHQQMLDSFLSKQRQEESQAGVKSYSQKASSISYDV